MEPGKETPTHNKPTMDREEIIQRLKQGVCKFTYIKSDGSERVAYGTLSPAVIDDLAPTSKTKRAYKGSSPTAQPYFDIVALSWRSFKIDSFVGFDESYGE